MDGTEVERRLRVACVWNGTFQAEELYADTPVRLGRGPDVLFGLPADVAPEETLTVIEPRSDGGWALRVDAPMRGDVWIAGERRDVSTLSAGELQIGDEDYGVLKLGTVALFFQSVKAPEAPPRDVVPRGGAFGAALGLSVFLHTSLVLLAAMTLYHLPEAAPLELPTDLITRFMVTPPPQDVLEEMSLTETPEAVSDDFRSRDEAPAEQQSAPAPEPSGTQGGGDEAPPPPPGLPDRFRGSLLDALSTGDNPIAEALGVDIGGALDSLDGVVFGPGEHGDGIGPGPRPGGPAGPLGPISTGDVGTEHDDGDLPDTSERGRDERRVPHVDPGRPNRNNDYLTERQIREVVERRSRALRFCYEVSLNRQPNLAGAVSIQWRIDLRGRVTSARVVSTTLGSARVEGCMVREVRSWQFPFPDGGEVVVTYPFLLGVRGG